MQFFTKKPRPAGSYTAEEAARAAIARKEDLERRARGAGYKPDPTWLPPQDINGFALDDSGRHARAAGKWPPDFTKRDLT